MTGKIKLGQSLQNQLNIDIKKQKGTVRKDLRQHFLHWNEKRQIFSGIDEKGEEWIAGVRTHVPCYWENCPNTIEIAHKGTIKSKKCNAPHFIPIFLDGKAITCTACGHKWPVKIRIPDNTPQKAILDRIRAESTEEEESNNQE